MIKVFRMQREGTNLLCNMIYSYPIVEWPKYSEPQAYTYGISGRGHRLQQFSQMPLHCDYLRLDNEINDKQTDQLVSLLGVDALRLYEKLLAC